MNPILQKKVERAVRLIQSVKNVGGQPIEVAYSGGKDSDVILELVRMSGVEYRAIYKCTTVDPPGTIKHCEENGVEIMRPKESFFKMMRDKGIPNRYYRFCCSTLKEYPVLYNVVIGVRTAESRKRAERYKEPVVCRVFNKTKDIREQQILPILDWTDAEELEFIKERGIKLHPLYYREDGTIDISRRLGCMCCPLMSKRRRIESFMQHPKMLRQYVRNAQMYLDSHPGCKTSQVFKNVYEWVCREIFFESNTKWNESKNGFFEDEEGFHKRFLEDYFHIKLD